MIAFQRLYMALWVFMSVFSLGLQYKDDSLVLT